jgi:hypothetical protein
MFDRGLRISLRNFSTLFLVVATILLPLHLIYAFSFRNVIATRDLHDDIRAFPTEGRQVKSVGKPQLRNAAIGNWVLEGLTLALLPLFLRAARRVQEVEAEGGVPDALDAWRHVRSSPGRYGWAEGAIPVILGGTLIALLVTALTQAIGLLLIEPIGDDGAWAAFGTVRAAARSAGLTFLLGALLISRIAKERYASRPNPY